MSKTVFFDGDPREPTAVAQAIVGADTVVYAPKTGLSGYADDVDRATRGTWVLATEAAKAGVKHLMVLSTQMLLARVPRSWQLAPNWRPRPAPDMEQLCPHLMELSLQAVARATRLHATVIRLGDDIDAAQAVDAALAEPSLPWRVIHVGTCASRPQTDCGKPWRTILGASVPVPSRPITRVAILGAGGPLGAAVADDLKDRYVLRLGDLRPLAQAKRQSPTAPLARPLSAPHEEVSVDVRDIDSVLDACRGCDALVNLAVVRNDPVDAFGVNTLGAYNVGRAAAQLGIRRVVQTGSQLIALEGDSDFTYDFNLAADTPPRPGLSLYAHSKYLGGEALRVLAEWHDLEVPNLMFGGIVQPDATGTLGASPLMISWQDAARAVRCAVEAAALPSPYEELICSADLPHAQCRSDKIARVLGWTPEDRLEGFWRAPAPRARWWARVLAARSARRK